MKAATTLSTNHAMLHNIKELYGHKITALDGIIGHVADFYFDDKTWVIRYLVVDTGSWLSGRRVLLSPHAFGKWDQYEKTLHVKLQKKQIQNSPSIESHKPVSRQYEIEFYKYYGWPVYWNGGAIWGLGGFPMVKPPSKDEMDAHLEQHHHRTDKHLQSAKSVTDYQIQALDEPIGQLSSFLVNDRSWVIRDLVIETGHWYSGKVILVSSSKVERISYEESRVYVNLSKADLKQTPDNDLASAGIGSFGEESLST